VTTAIELPVAAVLAATMKHLAVVERRWFERGLRQLPMDAPRDERWTLGPTDTITTLLANYSAARARSRGVAGARRHHP
jgi:hypothetical protein